MVVGLLWLHVLVARYVVRSSRCGGVACVMNRFLPIRLSCKNGACARRRRGVYRGSAENDSLLCTSAFFLGGSKAGTSFAAAEELGCGTSLDGCGWDARVDGVADTAEEDALEDGAVVSAFTVVCVGTIEVLDDDAACSTVVSTRASSARRFTPRM